MTLLTNHPASKHSSLPCNLTVWAVNGLCLIVLFLVLTNAVPLVQAGWLADFGKKSRYVRPILGVFAAAAVLLAGLRVYFPGLFQRILPVRVWKWLCLWPLSAVTAVFFAGYAGVLAWVGMERHLALETRAFDLGIFAQAVWNTTQGHFLFSSIKENICLLGDHVSPILLLTVPFYKLWPDPRTLIVLQALSSAAAFFPLARLAEKKLDNRSLTLLFLLMYCFYAPMRATLHEDFHPEVLAEPFLWGAFLFLEQGKKKAFLLCLIIAAAGKENFLGITAMFGFYAFVFKRMFVLGLCVMVASVGVFLWEVKWLVPHLTQGKTFFYAANYDQMLANPLGTVFSKLLRYESLEYAFKVFLPFLYLPFAHFPTLFLAFPVLFQNLLSDSGGMRSFNYHYLTGMTPFLFISAIYGLERLRRREVFRRHTFWIVFALLLTAVLRGGPSEYYFFWQTHSKRSVHTEMLRQKLNTVPREARVLTHNNFIPQLSNRQYVYQFDYNTQNTKLDFARRYQADYVIADAAFWEPRTQSPEEMQRDFLAAGYGLDFSQNGFFILKKKTA